MEDFAIYCDEELMQEISADYMFAFDALYESIVKWLINLNIQFLTSGKMQKILCIMYF